MQGTILSLSAHQTVRGSRAGREQLAKSMPPSSEDTLLSSSTPSHASFVRPAVPMLMLDQAEL